MNQRFSFQTGWKFLPDFRPEAVEVDYPLSLLASWEDVSLPHSLRLEPYRNGSIPTHQGLGMYRKHFRVEEALRDKLVSLEFEAVMGVTDVWLNGQLLHTPFADAAPDPDGTVHTNCGGYLPFVVELTPYLRYDADNVLVVLADNRDNGQLPPGKPQELLDFTYFGGIYRSVWLETREQVHITNPLREDLVRGGGVVFEITALSPEKAEVLVRTHIRNNRQEPQSLRLDVSLDDQTEASHAFTLEGGQTADIVLPLTVRDPRLWSPDEPSLYPLTCTLSQGETILHCHREQVGLRQITVSRTEGLLLNGKRLPLLSGVNRHQDFPLIGNAAPAALQREDAVLYKNAGFNVVRAAHYPMSVDFLKACDELGILLIEATPGWQWYPVGEDQPFTLRVHQNIRQMVRRDRNHPCILSYETVLNETYHVPRGYTRRMEEIALEESADARIAAESYGYDTAVNGVDDLADFIYGFQAPLEKTDKALQFHREYGDSWQEAYGNRMHRRVTRGDCGSEYPGGPKENLLKANNLLFDHQDDIYTLADLRKAYLQSPAFAGGAIWTGIDSRGMWSKVSPCGIWDPFRLPKTAYYAFASQRPTEKKPQLEALGVETGPLVHIGDPMEPANRDIYVYSNGCQAELRAEADGECFYACRQNPMEEGLCTWLEHPPFRFREVPWREGSCLTATVFDRDGKILAVSKQPSPGKPRRIRLRASSRALAADGSDIIPVYAEIIDENGTVCPDETRSVYLTLEGDGQILGDGDCYAAANPCLTEAGIAVFYIRAGTTPGELTIHAECAGLERGQLTLQLTAPTVPEFPFTPIPQGKPDPVCSRNLADKLISGGSAAMMKHRGIFYPASLLLEETSQFDLPEGCTKLYGRISMKRAGVLHLLADGVEFAAVTRSGKFCVNLPKMSRLTLRAPAGAKLLSPFLSDEPLSLQDTRKNLAVQCRCTASSHPADAGNVMKKGQLWETMWVGDPIDKHPEYFQVDLGRCFDIQDVMVYIGGQMGSDCTNYTYEIHTSGDGRHWEMQCRTRRTSWSNGVPDCFRAAQVRYVRVVFTKVDGGLLPALSKIHVYEDQHEKGEET